MTDVSDTERHFLVTWKRGTSAGVAPGNGSVISALHFVCGGRWEAEQRPTLYSEQDVTRKQYDGLLNDCLKHIPLAFWRGESREETILTYLSAVDDAMGLIAENIAARIVKEVE